MGDEITTTRTCGECTNVAAKCWNCMRWFCFHLLKNFNGHLYCADCYPKEAK